MMDYRIGIFFPFYISLLLSGGVFIAALADSNGDYLTAAGYGIKVALTCILVLFWIPLGFLRYVRSMALRCGDPAEGYARLIVVKSALLASIGELVLLLNLDEILNQEKDNEVFLVAVLGAFVGALGIAVSTFSTLVLAWVVRGFREL